MSKNTFTTAYNRTTSSIRDCNVVKFEKPSKVVQSLAYATDINNIYKDYVRTGKLPLNGAQPIYDENFVVYNDLVEASKLVDEATKYFSTLPAVIKNQYGNNLGEFVKALNAKDPYLVEQGLLQLPIPKDNIIIPDAAITPVQPHVNDVKIDVNTATTD